MRYAPGSYVASNVATAVMEAAGFRGTTCLVAVR